MPAILFAIMCFAVAPLRAQPLPASGAATVTKIDPGISNRDEYADLVFNGLKLNIVRYNIGGGENPDGPGTIQMCR